MKLSFGVSGQGTGNMLVSASVEVDDMRILEWKPKEIV